MGKLSLKKIPGMDKKQKKVVEKFNLGEVEDLWQSVLSEESTDNDDDDLFLDDLLYDEGYSGDGKSDVTDLEADDVTSEDYHDETSAGDEYVYENIDGQLDHVDDLYEEQPPADAATGEEFLEDVGPAAPERITCAAVLEFIGGMQQEVDRVSLFEPMENSLLLMDEETNDEQVIFFDQLLCLRISGLSDKISDRSQESCTREIIETVGGKKYHVLVHPEQVLENFLVCISSDDQLPYKFTLFPESNIVKRTQNRQLSDILLEKRFISKTIFQKARQEYEQLKKLTLEKIVAQKARIPLAEIEQAIDQARQNQMLGLRKEEILLFSGLVREKIILNAVEHLDRIKKLSLHQFLVDRRIVGERDIYFSLAEKHKIPFVDLKGRKFPKNFLTSLPKNMIISHEILPLASKENILLVATHSVDIDQLREEIIKIADCQDVKFVLSPPSQIRKIISVLFADRP